MCITFVIQSLKARQVKYKKEQLDYKLGKPKWKLQAKQKNKKAQKKELH